jgi:hypothetical protein
MSRQVSYNTPSAVKRRQEQAQADLKQEQQRSAELEQAVVEQSNALASVAIEALK